MDPRISLSEDSVSKKTMSAQERREEVLNRFIDSFFYMGFWVAIFFGVWYCYAGFTFPWWAPPLSLAGATYVGSRRLLRCR